MDEEKWREVLTVRAGRDWDAEDQREGDVSSGWHVLGLG